MDKIRILLADDHVVVRRGLRSLLSMEDDIEIVGEAADGQAAVEEARRTDPDVVVMDLVMPRMDGIAATAALRKDTPRAKILLLTTFSNSADIASALAAGARGALLKSSDDDEIVRAIRLVHSGERYVSPAVIQLLEADPPPPEFTQRQLDILAAVARGLTNTDISRLFGIAEITVKNHLKTIFTKLGAANRAEAVSLALRKRLVRT